MERNPAHNKHVPLVLSGSVLEEAEEENQGELAKPCSPEKGLFRRRW